MKNLLNKVFFTRLHATILDSAINRFAAKIF